jgi:hypothetical protein
MTMIAIHPTATTATMITVLAWLSSSACLPSAAPSTGFCALAPSAGPPLPPLPDDVVSDGVATALRLVAEPDSARAAEGRRDDEPECVGGVRVAEALASPLTGAPCTTTLTVVDAAAGGPVLVLVLRLPPADRVAECVAATVGVGRGTNVFDDVWGPPAVPVTEATEDSDVDAVTEPVVGDRDAAIQVALGVRVPRVPEMSMAATAWAPEMYRVLPS